MGSGNVWAPGIVPDHDDPPQSEENFGDRGIMAAYKEADKYVYEAPESRYCVIGPGCWLRRWEHSKGDKVKFKKAAADENVILRFECKSLNFEVNNDIAFLQSQYNWGYLYFSE